MRLGIPPRPRAPQENLTLSADHGLKEAFNASAHILPHMRKHSSSAVDWQTMPDDMQADLAQQALRRAALIIADQAELFSVQFVAGTLQDRGASDALTLFAALLRETTLETLKPMGSA